MVSGWPSKFTTGANCTMGGTWNYFWELNIEFGKKNHLVAYAWKSPLLNWTPCTPADLAGVTSFLYDRSILLTCVVEWSGDIFVIYLKCDGMTDENTDGTLDIGDYVNSISDIIALN